MKHRLLTYLFVILVGTTLFACVVSPLIFGIKQGLGDLLFAESMARNLFLEGGRWSDWAVTPSPAYLPDLLAYFVAFFIFNYPADRILFVCFIQGMLLIVATAYLIRRLAGSLAPSSLLWVFLFVSLVALLACTSRIWFFFDSTNNHFGAFLFGIYSLSLCLKMRTERVSALHALTLFALTCIGVLNGQLYLIWWCVPAIVTALLLACVHLYWSRNLYAQRDMLVIAGVTAGGIGVAYLLSPVVTPWDSLTLSGRAHFNWTHFFGGLQMFALSVAALWTSPRADFMVLYIFITVGLLVIFAQLLRMLVLTHAVSTPASDQDSLALCSFGVRTPAQRLSCREEFFVVFAAISILVTTFGTLSSGEFREGLSFRYFLMPIYLAVVTSGVIFLENGVARRFGTMVLGVFGCIALVSIAAVYRFYPSLKPRTVSLNTARSYQGTLEQEVAACLDGNRERYQLQDGVSDFWMARPIMLLSKSRLHVAPVKGGDFTAYHYMSNVTWFLGGPNAPVPEPHYNFVVVNGFSESDVIREFGGPTERFECARGRVAVLVYNTKTTQFDLKLKRKFEMNLSYYRFKLGKTSSFRLAPEHLMISQGVLSHGVAKSLRGAPGWFIIGPYLPLEPGTYSVKMRYRLSSGGRQDQGSYFEVFSNPNHFFSKAPLMSGDDYRDLELRFKIARLQSRLPMEFRVFTSGLVQIEIAEVVLVKDS